ncbi:MAG TPA: 2-oxoacid ferredoxin oxidoreductase [Clostridiales bacterium]|nr:2-oxoacid ferredoxin oxidoreductase [Clostridiales bacterium]
MTSPRRFDVQEERAWCPGCGNYVLLACLKEALHRLDKQPHEVLICSGIGQAAKLPHYIKVNCFNGLHGRSLPAACAAKIVNPALAVIVSTGDGDSYGEGGNHFLHAIRRNVDIAHFVHNNGVYGLTKGQASPTMDLGRSTPGQAGGVRSDPLNPLALAISQDAGFVARGFTGEREHLIELMKAAIDYRGYALVDILQPCPVYNKVNTLQWYKERVRPLGGEHDPADRLAAFAQSLEGDDGGIPIGVIYRKDKPTFADRLSHLAAGAALVDKALDPRAARVFMDPFF